MQRETIAAIATASGRGGIGILRISGGAAVDIVQALIGTVLPHPRQVSLRRFLDQAGGTIDQGLVLYFKAPNSYTGEDVVELHAHGSMVVLRMLLHRVCTLGARPARPGEFTERAFLNDKLDLAQAEAVADLIDASTFQAARSAQQSLSGVFSKHISDCAQKLMALRVLVEASLDFPDEDLDVLTENDALERIDTLIEELACTLLAARQGQRIRDGVKMVLAGAPNVGKSSLLNALAGQETAIVTDVPGTTRDIVRTRFEIEGLCFDLADTAGLRQTIDPVEQKGIERTEKELAEADLIVVVHDASSSMPAEFNYRSPNQPLLGIVTVFNKVDLCTKPAGTQGDAVWLSAKTGEGLADLRRMMLDRAGLSAPSDVLFSARERHVLALERCMEAVRRARAALDDASAVELAAEDLRGAQYSLHEIIGIETADDLLGRIFSTFCIGK